jgi:Holliday junction resolvasome RuvABC endonuclease subunit
MRFLRFRRWLDEVTDLAGGLGMIVYEQVRRHVGTDASHAYGGWLAILSAWCEQKSIAYEGVPVGTIKRYATGKGNADKATMVAAMRARGFAPADDNEADALALLLWATDAEGGRA